MAHVIYDYEIPDLDQPIPADERGLGPSGHLQPFAPPPISAEQVIGRTVEEICPHVGTYGMGGPGFFGLRLGSEWLVIALWGAGDWMVSQGRCVQDSFYDNYGRPRPWIVNWPTDESDELSAQLVGERVSSIDVRLHSLRIVFENELDLTIEETSERRPLFEGIKQTRQFNHDDDLRRAVFLAPTIEIWV
jgi:hypothetical protein